MAGGKIQMNPEDARNWISQIEALNSELDVAVNGSAQAVSDVQASSSGSLVDELCGAIGEMFDAAKNMVNAFGELAESVWNVVNVGAQVAEEISGLVKVAATVIGL